MANAINKLANLGFENVKWITQLRNKLCETGNISDEDIKTAFNEIFSKDEFKESANIPEIISRKSTDRKSILYRLSENQNVGGLLDNQEIVFSPYFTSVFGKNGTGKSTYYKILKDAFHSNQDIKTNIYNTNQLTANAKISFTKKNAYLKHQKGIKIEDFDAMEVSNDWIPNSKISAKIKFCDSDILQNSLRKKDAGWDIDRFKLGYYDKFRESIEIVENNVNDKLSTLLFTINSDKITLNSNLKDNSDGSYKTLISNNTIKQNSLLIARLLKLEFTEKDKLDKENFEKDLQTNVKELAEKIDDLKISISICEKEKGKLKYRFDVISNIDEIILELKNYNDLVGKRNYSSFEKYEFLFSLSDNFESSSPYIILLKSIADTALKYGYENYPENIEKCFYCNQDLPDLNKKLIIELNSMVNSTLEKEINIAKKIIEQRSSLIDENILKKPFQDLYSIDIEDAFSLKTKEKIDIINLFEEEKKSVVYSNLKISLDNFQEISIIEKLHLNKLDDLIQFINSDISLKTSKLNDLNTKLSSFQTVIETAKKELNKIYDLEFITKNISFLSSFQLSINTHIKYSDLSFGGYKTKISKDKSKVEDELVRNNYNSVFYSNTEKFNLQKRDKISRDFIIKDGFTKVEPKIKTDNGNFTVQSILSEGEAKIYALCDWLTELEFENIDTLIFDDPINSLDQRNIEKISDIITNLCKKYQVIVFTHNLEFYDRLIKKTLGTNTIDNSSCEICNDVENTEKCHGKQSNSSNLYKCGNYFKIEYTTQPGKTLKDLDFFRFSYKQRIEDLKSRIINGRKEDLSKDIRITINNYFENYFLADIKRDVFKGEDLIHNWKKIKDISDEDYLKLMEIHNKLSSKSIHEPSLENNSELDILDFKNYMNDFLKVINNNGIKIELLN